MLHIDLWQSRLSGIPQHRMHLCKQAEADSGVDSEKNELEEGIGVMKLYIHVYQRQIRSITQLQRHRAASKCLVGDSLPGL